MQQFVNWGEESQEQRTARRKYEEEQHQEMIKAIMEARNTAKSSSSTAAVAAGGGGGEEPIMEYYYGGDGGIGNLDPTGLISIIDQNQFFYQIDGSNLYIANGSVLRSISGKPIEIVVKHDLAAQDYNFNRSQVKAAYTLPANRFHIDPITVDTIILGSLGDSGIPIESIAASIKVYAKFLDDSELYNYNNVSAGDGSFADVNAISPVNITSSEFDYSTNELVITGNYFCSVANSYLKARINFYRFLNTSQSHSLALESVEVNLYNVSDPLESVPISSVRDSFVARVNSVIPIQEGYNLAQIIVYSETASLRAFKTEIWLNVASFKFKSSTSEITINVQTDQLGADLPITVDWGDGYKQTVQGGGHSYYLIRNYDDGNGTGKTAEDEMIVTIQANSAIALYIIYVPLTLFEVISLPYGLQVLVLNNTDVTSFDGTFLPPSLIRLALISCNLSAFDTPLPNGLQELLLMYNQLTRFDPSIALPDSLTLLELSGNLLTTFDPANPLPASLETLALSDNGLQNFMPPNGLPNGLLNLYLNGNQINNQINDSVFPDSLQVLRLSNNSISGFDPTNPLPIDLLELNLYNNPLTVFSPSHDLPSKLETLNLGRCSLNSSDTISLPPSLKYLYLANNSFTSFDRDLPSNLLDLDLSNCASLTNFSQSHNLPGLRVIDLRHCASLTDFNVTISNDTVNSLQLFLGYCYGLETFTPTKRLPPRTQIVDLSHCAFSTNTVDSILAYFDIFYQLGYFRTNGQLLDLSFNDGPSPTGLATIVNLTQKGWTVYVNN